ncbi:MAG: hypothetical protein MI802_21345 [Desulfobacterales bacterium]|nr:hypothetical protein [Desulfobacterales bacterium]
MKIANKPPFVDRRKSKDVLARAFIWINYVAWAILFVTLLVFHRAQPEFETLFDRFYRLNLRTEWDTVFLRYLVYVVGIGLTACLAGLGLAMVRARRKTDHKVPIIILGGLYVFLFILSWFLFLR